MARPDRFPAPLLGLLFAAAAAAADGRTVVAAHTLRAQSLIGPNDLSTIEATLPGTISDPAELIGMEARVVLYAGRPIRPQEIGPPTLVDRNQIVPLSFRDGGLSISAEGRALSRGGVGDTIRVLNTTSHNTVTGTVAADGSVVVGAN